MCGYPASSLQGGDGSTHHHPPTHKYTLASWGKGGRESDNIVFEWAPALCTCLPHCTCLGSMLQLLAGTSSETQQLSGKPRTKDQGPEKGGILQLCLFWSSDPDPEEVTSVDPTSISYPPSQSRQGAPPAKDRIQIQGGEGGEETGWLWSGLDSRKETEA